MEADRALAERDLLAEIQRLAEADEQEAIAALATAEWPRMKGREPNREDAESCRLTMLALYKLGRQNEGRVWRVRAMLGSARAGWPIGVAALVTGEAFQLQSEANAGVAPSDPAYVLVEESLEILDELLPLIGPEGPDGLPQPSPELLGRIYHEKRAFLLFAGRRFADAQRDYESAGNYVRHDDRGRLKVAGGLAACRYASDPEANAIATIAATEAVAAESSELGHVEIHRIAAANLDRMRAGRLDLVPYETL
jgi:hypothetical protein